MSVSGVDAGGAPGTVAEALGQIVWLLEQSPLHRELKIKDLAWSIMPAVAAQQFRIFRFGPTPAFATAAPGDFAMLGLDREGLERLPLGVAIWAKLTPEGEAKLESGQRLTLEEWSAGESLWLVELISPFATPDNRLQEVMLADLMQGPFLGKSVSLHRSDPATGARVKVSING
jgi:cytolysin-activating lysine-acyltransferase